MVVSPTITVAVTEPAPILGPPYPDPPPPPINYFGTILSMPNPLYTSGGLIGYNVFGGEDEFGNMILTFAPYTGQLSATQYALNGVVKSGFLTPSMILVPVTIHEASDGVVDGSDLTLVYNAVADFESAFTTPADQTLLLDYLKAELAQVQGLPIQSTTSAVQVEKHLQAMISSLVATGTTANWPSYYV